MFVNSDYRKWFKFVSCLILFLSFFAMQLILVLVPYGIDLQNPHLMDADFSWLRHIATCCAYLVVLY